MKKNLAIFLILAFVTFLYIVYPSWLESIEEKTKSNDDAKITKDMSAQEYVELTDLSGNTYFSKKGAVFFDNFFIGMPKLEYDKQITQYKNKTTQILGMNYKPQAEFNFNSELVALYLFGDSLLTKTAYNQEYNKLSTLFENAYGYRGDKYQFSDMFMEKTYGIFIQYENQYSKKRKKNNNTYSLREPLNFTMSVGYTEVKNEDKSIKYRQVISFVEPTLLEAHESSLKNNSFLMEAQRFKTK